ncbi:MAG: two component transcriptional regulator, LuxR family protein [Osedax symbiont Rs1]|nr:MAG: two component transcriptional regulator, LuxR family protein [Osedax symbiont Rs1]
MTIVEKIIIADDHPLFRKALSEMLKSHFNRIELLEVDSVTDLEEILQETTADLVLLDLDFPGTQGFNTLIQIRHQYPELAVVIVSGIEDKDTIQKAMMHGAAGFIPKSTAVSEMMVAIERIFQGELWTPTAEHYLPKDCKPSDASIDSLTPQQHKILLMFADGLLNKQIAYELGVAESTVKSHASTIFLKLGVRNRTQAVIKLNDIYLAHTSFGPSVR